MQVEIKNGNLIVTIPHNNLKALPESKSRLSYNIITSSGNQPVSLLINGKQEVVKVGLNAFIPIPGRRKLKDGSVVDEKGNVIVAAGQGE